MKPKTSRHTQALKLQVLGKMKSPVGQGSLPPSRILVSVFWSQLVSFQLWTSSPKCLASRLSLGSYPFGAVFCTNLPSAQRVAHVARVVRFARPSGS